MSNAFYDSLRPELEEWVRWHRVPSIGPLDIEATAERIGIRVEFCAPKCNGVRDRDPRHGAQGTLQLDDTVTINPYWDEDGYRTTFGHEVGHWLIRREIAFEGVRHGNEEEGFCERLGHELALPLHVAKGLNIQEVPEVARLMKVDMETAFFQLYAAGIIPPLIEIEEYGFGMLCVSCDDPYRTHPAVQECACKLLWRRRRPSWWQEQLSLMQVGL